MSLIKGILILVLVATASISCARRQTAVSIKQGNPQQFIVSGTGLLDDFVINGPDLTRSPYMKVYWEIAPFKDFDVSHFAELGPIIYGIVPEGFRQVTPATGQPPPITNGSPYSLQLAIRNGGGVNMLFGVYGDRIVTEAESD
jgi:hypothetical protein